MCFSASASFTAGAALAVIGTAAVSKTERPSHVPFAAMPVLFGVQQVAEGVVWLSLANPVALAVGKYAFLFFSHVLWPVFVPLSICLIEPSRWRRRVLSAFVALGAVVSAYFLYYLFQETVDVAVFGKRIVYVAPHFSVSFLLSPYTVATCASCLFSSHRIVNFFGVVTFLSAIAVFRFYEQAFVSVWCFFAAILSVLVFVHFAVGAKALIPRVRA